MKQNSQWLSQVRTWSKSADCTSTPERLAGPLVDLDGQLEAPAPEVEHGIGVVDQEPPLDDVAGHLAVDGVDLVAHLDARERPPANRARQRRLEEQASDKATALGARTRS